MDTLQPPAAGAEQQLFVFQHFQGHCGAEDQSLEMLLDGALLLGFTVYLWIRAWSNEHLRKPSEKGAVK